MQAFACPICGYFSGPGGKAVMTFSPSFMPRKAKISFSSFLLSNASGAILASYFFCSSGDNLLTSLTIWAIFADISFPFFLSSGSSPRILPIIAPEDALPLYLTAFCRTYFLIDCSRLILLHIKIVYGADYAPNNGEESDCYCKGL